MGVLTAGAVLPPLGPTSDHTRTTHAPHPPEASVDTARTLARTGLECGQWGV